MFISSHFSLNCIFDKMQPGVEDQLIKLLIETQKHDPVKIFNFDIQTNVRKGVLLISYIAPSPGSRNHHQRHNSQNFPVGRLARAKTFWTERANHFCDKNAPKVKLFRL